MKMPSVTSYARNFSKVPQANIPRSTFNRSHGYKTTFDEGLLIPVFVDEVYPGDTFKVHMTAFARLSTPIKPIMDNMYLESFFFFVPNRLLWDNWTKFMGEQDDPGDSIAYNIPKQQPHAAGINTGSLEDYFGMPVGVASSAAPWTFSALPRRAYAFIWNEWFRDQNLQDSRDERGNVGGLHARDNGPDTTGSGGTALFRINKRHDYFTSCLPWQQRGDAVDVPLGAIAGTGTPPVFQGVTSSNISNLEAQAAGPGSDVGITGVAWTVNEALDWATPNLEVTPPTINELRESFQIQKLLERDARSGRRYPETIRAHFGVSDPSMAILQRPEYLGGGRANINVQATAQTGPSDDGAGAAGTPQGNLAGIGTMVANRHGFTKSFTEHGIVMGLVAVRADLTYQQGIERWWSRDTRYDFYYPSFAHLGEQAVLNKEIYTQDAAANDDVFGYQERFGELRYKPSKVTGAFRSNTAGGTATLEIWHLSQDFAALPTLNSAFIQENADVDRIIEVTSEPHFYFDAWFEFIAARPLPVFAVPGLIDHF